MKGLRYYWLLVFLSVLVCPLALMAEGDTLLLKQQLDAATTPTEQAEAYLALADAHVNINGNTALIWAQKAYMLAQAEGINEPLNRARLAVAKAYMKIDALSLSERYLNEALRHSDTTANTLFIANLNSHQGRLDMLLGHYPHAAKHLLAAATIYRSLDDTKGLATTYNNIGNLYAKQSIWYLAKQHYKLALPLYQSLNLMVSVSHLYNNLAGVYLFQDSIEQCFEHLDQSLAIKETLGIPLEIATA